MVATATIPPPAGRHETVTLPASKMNSCLPTRRRGWGRSGRSGLARADERRGVAWLCVGGTGGRRRGGPRRSDPGPVGGPCPPPRVQHGEPDDAGAGRPGHRPSGHPSALVAIDTRTGAVLAAASNPAGYSRALLGEYPPGSTFKMVTLTAALMSGRTLATPTSRSPSVTVDGNTMHNASGESLGTIPLQQAFAVSCNTSFINLAESLPTGALATAAKLMGCDTGHAPLTVPSYGCSYPAGATGSGYAASAIGQGTVLTSPLSIASIAAAADSGAWKQPHLSPGAAPASHPLPAAVVVGLQQAMRAVVTSGTGTGANLPGTPVYGKTGTAEIGTGSNPPTDAWFAAYRGNVGVAMFGGETPHPALHRRPGGRKPLSSTARPARCLRIGVRGRPPV
jgi:membrane peptidoglycan carboxypeptidase